MGTVLALVNRGSVATGDLSWPVYAQVLDDAGQPRITSTLGRLALRFSGIDRFAGVVGALRQQSFAPDEVAAVGKRLQSPYAVGVDTSSASTTRGPARAHTARS